MDFLNKVKEIASSVAAVSVRKGKEIRDIAKIKLEIADKQNKVKNLYKEIGYEAYKEYKAQGDILGAIKERIEIIDSIEDEIAALRKELDEVGNIEEVKSSPNFEDDEEATEADFDEIETEPIDPIE